MAFSGFWEVAIKIHFLPRPRINEKLNNLFSYPLTIVHAPLGYGKTTAVSAFLQGQACKVIRIPLTGGSADELWTRLSAQMSLAGLKLGDDLKAMGFPSDQLKADWVTERLLDYDFTPPVVVVFAAILGKFP